MRSQTMKYRRETLPSPHENYLEALSYIPGFCLLQHYSQSKHANLVQLNKLVGPYHFAPFSSSLLNLSCTFSLLNSLSASLAFHRAALESISAISSATSIAFAFNAKFPFPIFP